MLSFALFGVAFAGCGLSADIDPNGACVTDDNGYSTLDADTPDVPISLAIISKDATTDAFKMDHPATAGALDLDADNGRYILACKQVEGKKTVKMSVTRPVDMTAFGAEWVQLFPKDSWSNVTNEYEPFTFNEYGAKIPLFRAPSTGLADDAPNEGVVHVYMEVSDEGDYEVMYGNPGLQYDDKWVAVQFKSTLLRVGTPWAECSDSTLGAASYDVGSIMPILFGGPNLNSIALPAGNPSYFDVIAELSGVTVPVKIVLEIFSATKTSYTDSAESYGMCYKSGNACPEVHAVCKAEYCEMDVWKQLIADFKAAGSVTVLGSLDSSTAKEAYDDLDMDGFYLASTGGSPRTSPGGDCSAEVPYDHNGGENGYLTWKGTYASGWEEIESSCYTKVHISDDVIMSKTLGSTVARWRDSFNSENGIPSPSFGQYMVSVPVMTDMIGKYVAFTFPSEMTMNGFRAGCDDQGTYSDGSRDDMNEFDIQYLSTGADREWVTVANTNYARTCDFIAPPVTWAAGPSSEQWRFVVTDISHNQAGSSNNNCGYYGFAWYAGEPGEDLSDTVTVSAIGSPLFDEGAVADATVYLTLAAKDLGVWNPFSWYPYVAPSKWAAIVTEASDVSAVETLVDRGYGWVYITSEVGFNTKNTLAMSDLLAALESPATRRKLQERRLETSAPYWGCDDTLLECKPVCIKQTGIVSTRVSDTLCASAPMDQCACKCFHEAQWTCEGSSVVCKAKYGAGKLRTVGDKVCETRGAPKPSSTAELRIASMCKPVTEMRGSAPTAECLAQWGTPEPTDAPDGGAATEETPEDRAPLLVESFAATSALALAGLSLYA
jgi:hypothetical protein